jgi:hypothetical protein
MGVGVMRKESKAKQHPPVLPGEARFRNYFRTTNSKATSGVSKGAFLEIRGLNVLCVSQKAALKAEPEEHGDGGKFEDPRWEAKKGRRENRGRMSVERVACA